MLMTKMMNIMIKMEMIVILITERMQGTVFFASKTAVNCGF